MRHQSYAFLLHVKTFRPIIRVVFSLLFLCPLGIIDLSQVPHLPVLVPPSAGTAGSPMDRITYIPGGSTTFPGRPYTTSPISPGTIQLTLPKSPRD